MFGNKPSTDSGAQAQREQITKYLRAADEFFRFSRFDEALLQIDQALIIDPKNVLARSFKERVKMMQKRMENFSQQGKKTEMSEEDRQAIVSRLLGEADVFIRAKDYKHALNKIAEVYKIDPQNYFAKAYSDRIEELQEQQKNETAKFFDESASQTAAETQPSHGAFYMYRELMKEVWFDGKVTQEEAQELKIVRDLFGISNKEHFDIEREVKIEAYLEALRLAWRDGVLTVNEKQTLEMMRQKFGITIEEHIASENQVQEAKKGTPTRATILVVDSDNAHRTSIAAFLKRRNYEVLAAASIEEAFKLIVDQFPHLVLAEIVYSPNQQDGFALYEKMQEHQTLQHVPFFFMSRMKDGKVIRAAMRLGLDLHFPKPVDQELLLAAVEGRLRKH
jgi:CheY-like chemotaxis protein